jgi:hypothetical protein
MYIESGLGNGKTAGIDEDNRLLTASFNIPFSHLIAKDYQNSFAVSCTATPNPGGVTVAVLENTSPDKQIVITRLTLQSLVSGGTNLPSVAGGTWDIEMNSVYQSGGVAVSPVNISSGSNVVAPVRVFEGGAALAGAPDVAYTLFALPGQPIDLQTEGNAIVLPGKAVSVGFYGDNTAGAVVANLSFVVVDSDGYSG